MSLVCHYFQFVHTVNNTLFFCNTNHVVCNNSTFRCVYISSFFLLGDIEHLFKILTLDKLKSCTAYFYSYIFKLGLFPSLLLLHTGLHKAWEPPCLCSAGQTTAGSNLNGKSMHSYFTFPQIYHSYHLIKNLYSFKLQVFLWQDIK